MLTSFLFSLVSLGDSFGSRGLLLLGEKGRSNSAKLILARSCYFSNEDKGTQVLVLIGKLIPAPACPESKVKTLTRIKARLFCLLSNLTNLS